jgi:hypothetical protein
MTMFKLLIVVSLTAPLIAHAAGKPAWQWTEEERIALRTDAKLAEERVRNGARVEASSVRSATPQVRTMADAFDGKTHPELFLPHQVFDELINLAFLGSARTGQVVREGFMPEIKRRGLPADFWLRLQSVSAVYIADSSALDDFRADIRQQAGRGQQRAEVALAQKAADACRSRADALASARREFGRERFDRFLYEVIAVNMFSIADRLPDPESLRQAERGCR